MFVVQYVYLSCTHKVPISNTSSRNSENYWGFTVRLGEFWDSLITLSTAGYFWILLNPLKHNGYYMNHYLWTDSDQMMEVHTSVLVKLHTVTYGADSGQPSAASMHNWTRCSKLANTRYNMSAVMAAISWRMFFWSHRWYEALSCRPFPSVGPTGKNLAENNPVTLPGKGLLG